MATATKSRNATSKRNTTTATSRKQPVTTSNKSAVSQTRTSTPNAKGNQQQSQNKSEQKEEKSLLDKLFVNMLKDIYWAEKHLVEALKEMEDNATTDELKDAFEDHRIQTTKHISRLEKVFKLIGEEAQAKKCDAMEGLTKEAKAMMSETKEGTMTRDAALIIAAQKVEHYEIATYGSLVQVALTLGHDKAAGLLDKTLQEEEDTDLLLTDIAESFVNPMADDEDVNMQSSSEEDEEDEEEEEEEE
ncbi:ferritin-like metal-binding protein YciE [Chitinophaga skermanii]|uniref:Ferritin-like metal-binding protein YciE n=1 Tax=Chitinophaga skermanii TaxID=331697 RepID=A0A327QAP4_9BACT|nr:ferritin-like domain-containing protein [Chitinophaga skermanii]RAJ00283.1 ferritin-like metal-binding protein YciE [Chitinophaga skermanii]